MKNTITVYEVMSIWEETIGAQYNDPELKAFEWKVFKKACRYSGMTPEQTYKMLEKMKEFKNRG